MELYWPQILWKIWCSPEAWGITSEVTKPDITETREKCFDITKRAA